MITDVALRSCNSSQNIVGNVIAIQFNHRLAHGLLMMATTQQATRGIRGLESSISRSQIFQHSFKKFRSYRKREKHVDLGYANTQCNNTNDAMCHPNLWLVPPMCNVFQVGLKELWTRWSFSIAIIQQHPLTKSRDPEI